jgi:hypothetical protein
MLNRRKFLHKSLLASVGLYLLPKSLLANKNQGMVMTITGPIRPDDMKFTLTHEHVLVDFIGAEKYSKERYVADEVFARALPFIRMQKAGAALLSSIAHRPIWEGMSNCLNDWPWHRDSILLPTRGITGP